MVKITKPKSTKKAKQAAQKSEVVETKSQSEITTQTPILNLKKVEIDNPLGSQAATLGNKINYKLIAVVGIVNVLVIALIISFFVFHQRKDNSNSNSDNSSISSQEVSTSSQNSEADNSSNSSQESSTESSSSSQSVEVSSSSSAGPAAVSYTNPFYPDLKINYDSSWAFSTSTSKSNYTGVLNRQLLFIKNGVTFEVNIYPVFATGCGGPNKPVPMKETKIGGKISRYRSTYRTNSYHYLTSGGSGDEDCAFFGMSYINSNVVSKDFTAAMGDKYVYSFINISVTGSDQNTIKEVDKIVLNSKFISRSR